MLINELDTIDLHHATYSANPPYTVLDVIGTLITARLRAELGEYGFDDFQETPQGFRAVRPIPDDPASELAKNLHFTHPGFGAMGGSQQLSVR